MGLRRLKIGSLRACARFECEFQAFAHAVERVWLQWKPPTTKEQHDHPSHRGRIELEHPTETRPAVRTTEFFVLLASVALVIVVGYSGDDTLDTRTIWTLVTVLASAYMLSRGIAKAGSYEHRSDIDVNTRDVKTR